MTSLTQAHRFAHVPDPAATSPRGHSITTPPQALLDAAVLIATFFPRPVVRRDLVADVASAWNFAHSLDSSRHTSLAGGLLVVSAHLNGHRTADALINVGDAAYAVETHDATDGHDLCCGGECPCDQPDTVRCADCEQGPRTHLAETVAVLFGVVADTLRPDVVTDLYAAVA